MTVTTGFRKLAELPEKRVSDEISWRMVSGNKGMIVWWTLKAGAHVGAHSHPHEQVAWVLSGKVVFRLGDERRTMGPGEVVVIPSGVEHETYFPEDTEMVDIFAPPREDYLEGGKPAWATPTE